MKKIDDVIRNIVDNKYEIIERINNTSYEDVLKLRNEAAERGIEFTPNEIIEHINLLKEIVSDG